MVPIGITRDGAWTLQPDDPELFGLRAELPSVVDNGTRVRLPDAASSREFTLVAADGSVSSLGAIDVVFPILHGRFGEDGTVQGELELLGLPYVGNGVLASALAMDKHMTKSVLVAAGIEVAPWVTLTPSRWTTGRELFERRIRALGLPVFVKPSRAGSSVGVTKVADWAELDAAVDIAFDEDTTVLVEAAIVGREVECAVLEGRDGGEPRVSVAGEIVVTGPRVLRLRGEVPRPGCRAADLPGRAGIRRTARDAADRRRGRSRRSAGRASRGSTSSSAARASSSTRSTRCRASPRSRCSPAAGRPAA